jgi:hypothetical protein
MCPCIPVAGNGKYGEYHVVLTAAFQQRRNMVGNGVKSCGTQRTQGKAESGHCNLRHAPGLYRCREEIWQFSRGLRYQTRETGKI